MSDTISERLRGWLQSSSPERHEAIEAELPDVLNTIDALVAALDRMSKLGLTSDTVRQADAALALARKGGPS